MITIQEAADYGIDWDGPMVNDEAQDRVTVPEIPSYLNACQLSFLKTLVDPLQHCDDHGKGYYTAVRQLVREMIDQ